MVWRSRYDKEIFALALPALGSLAIDPLVSLVDTAFVGRLGAAQLGALGINAAIFAMTFVVFNFLAYGTTPRVGALIGSGQREEAGRVAAHALMIATVCGALALGAIQLLAPWVLELMGATGELAAPALTYLRIRALAGPAVLLTMAAHGIFRGYQDTRTPLRVTMLVNLINVLLDPLLIFGLGWGIAGAAWATLAAQWTGALLFLVLLFSGKNDAIDIKLELPSARDLEPFLRAGSSLLLRTGALVGTMGLATAVAARMGVAAAAGHQVANELWGFMALVVDALAVAGQALVARYLGENDREGARAVSNRLLFLGLVVGSMLGAVMWALEPWLGALFTDDAVALASLASVFPVVVFLQPLNGLVFVWDGVYMGAQRFVYLAFAMVLSVSVAAAVLSSAIPMGWGLRGVWAGITALMAMRLVTLAIPWIRRTAFGKEQP